eukprot:CAMPEP_0206407966 /NCGR_PEP_ID=MMETSP0294-20121207/30838_1 /ASSEMBLY_ACC=CAM_ASM_000327 /TAXON_ID=39354 /ORGANISM="Heterosigma akashiwo, Strain CCMP2393" /LENGTH=165 /DNA_ID=CAMNT_0053867275 /DNA_START=220 /DNA_END=714 /DNA_ORIENTATION=-
MTSTPKRQGGKYHNSASSSSSGAQIHLAAGTRRLRSSNGVVDAVIVTNSVLLPFSGDGAYSRRLPHPSTLPLVVVTMEEKLSTDITPLQESIHERPQKGQMMRESAMDTLPINLSEKRGKSKVIITLKLKSWFSVCFCSSSRVQRFGDYLVRFCALDRTDAVAAK